MKKLIEKLLTVNRLVRDKFDKGRVNGGLDQKELKTMFANSGVIPLTVKKFNKADTNKNGKIEESELGPVINVFVLSYLRLTGNMYLVFSCISLLTNIMDLVKMAEMKLEKTIGLLHLNLNVLREK